jgi:hypothetical protein
MKTSLRISYCCLFLLVSTVAMAQTEQEFKTTSKSVIGYVEYLPPDYNTNSFDYPIVIFLHGKGERGPDSDDPEVLKTGYSKLVFYGPPKHVRLGEQFPFILISPQLKLTYSDWPAWYVMEVIEHVKTYLRIDKNRIYLTGTSLGGGGTWVTAQTHPDYFGAVAPVAGSTNSPSKACLIAASNLPVWAFHGDADNVVSVNKSITMVNAINACNPSVRAMLKIYEGVGHNAYAYAYDPGYKYQKPNIYEWMLSWDKNVANRIPKASAGSDQTLSSGANSITLSGTGSDADGTIVNYSWAKMSGGNVTFSGRTSSKVTLSNLEEGTYVFRLTVRDDKGAIATDDVSVFVTTGTNALPTVNAGEDKTITLPTNSVTLTGTASDPDGSIVSYAWTKVAGGAATLSGASTATLKASGLEAGTYTFRLTVKDNSGATKYDDVKVYVNIPPTVNAGADKTIVLPQNSVTFTGSASDPDGSIVSYAWSQVSGGASSLSGTSTLSLTASGLLQGTYVFRLTVKDDRGASKYDEVTLTVNAEIVNATPVANAGSDKVVTLPSNSVTLQGTGTDSDGVIVSYSWKKVSGGSATLSGANTSKLNASGLEAGLYVFRLTVKDDNGASHSDDVSVFVNQPPIVNAGADKVITLPVSSLSIQASASDVDGSIAQYTWTKISGGSAAMSGTTTSKLSVTGLEAGSYVFRITVHDDKGASKYDEVAVLVNRPPVVNAGSDKVITLPTNEVIIQASASDADGTVTHYAWSKIAGGTATLSGVMTSKLAAGSLAAGTYVFRITVKDDKGGSASDDITVVVNSAPVVNAGADATIHWPASTVTISGTVSDDGTINSYSWSKRSGGAAVLSGTATPTLKVSGMEPGVYDFRLTVKDNHGAVAYDEVRVVVNRPPVVNAGADITIALPVNSAVLTGSATDPDGSASRLTYKWRKVSGGAAVLTGASTLKLTVTSLEQGNYVFRLTVTDNLGGSHSDDVVVTVKASSLPLADAGDDKIVVLPVDEVILKGTGATAVGSIVSYRWEQVAGSPVTMIDDDTPVLTITGVTAAGTYSFRLTVVNSVNYSAIDDVKVYYLDGGVIVDRNADLTLDRISSKEEPFASMLLADDPLRNCPECNYIVYDQNLNTIHNGKWERDSFQRVFAREGLYYYNVELHGRVLRRGKLYRE